MPVQPFTPAGVAAKQTELYALSDTDLETQAGLIQSNMQSWVTSNFDLTTAQSTYLSGIDSRWIKYNANLISFAVSNRLNVTLAVTGDPSGLKLIHTTDNVVVTSSGTDFSAAGSVSLSVAYS